MLKNHIFKIYFNNLIQSKEAVFEFQDFDKYIKELNKLVTILF